MKTSTTPYDKNLEIIKRLHDMMQNQIRTDAALADQLLHDLAWNILELRHDRNASNDRLDKARHL